MGIGDNIIGGAILLAVIIGIRSIKCRAESGCCGGGGSCETVKTKAVSDTDPEHYAYTAELKVEGMHCGNCKARVENALNALSGDWASADLSAGTVTVRMKQRRTEAELREAVRRAGYSVTGFTLQG